MMLKVKKCCQTQVDAPDNKCFWVKDGQVLRNLKDLSFAFGLMTNETYSYHVNEDKNDFAKWVREVLGDDCLAEKLEIAKTREAAKKGVEKCL
jgi:hypothetical protein